MASLKILAKQSIAVRLAVSALFWCVLILLIASAILSALYREATERAFDQRLLVYANDLAADLATPGDPERREIGSLGNPQFDIPFSGWYWQAGRPNAAPRDIRASRSLFGSPIPSLPRDDQRFGEIRKGYKRGPEEHWLRIIERDIDLGEDGRFIVAVAGPAEEIDKDVRRFTAALTITFVFLGAALGATILFQIRFGLQPLLKLRSALAAVRRGEAERIPGAYPRDIAPLAQELNLLLDANREILERARTQVGNLAHALKTPLSVIVNEAEHAPEDLSVKIREQASVMRDQVNYHLNRARAAALAGTLGAITEVEPVVAGLVRTFEKIYRGKGVSIGMHVAPGVRFRGERQDFEEMVGNLVDNACKWAPRCVAVEVTVGDHNGRLRLCVAVEDDGPGLPQAAAQDMLKRGRRLDETKPGSGLGLSIVADLATLYQGSLRFETAALGGLRAVLDLPGDRA